MDTLKKIRRERNLTQLALARLSGLTESKICKIETERIVPTYEEKKKIADVLGIQTFELFYR